MPIAMIGLGDRPARRRPRPGRYGRAGALSATFALVNAAAAPAIARLVDRLAAAPGPARARCRCTWWRWSPSSWSPARGCADWAQVR
jgi:hypothetical protein